MAYLYHYTALEHLLSIMEEKKLRLSESNLTDWRKHTFDVQAYNEGRLNLYKPVVWMTTEKEPDAKALGLTSSVLDKSVIRITIKKRPYFKKWRDWSRKNNINKEWAKHVEKDRNANTWWISELTVSLKDIVMIENRITGEICYSDTTKEWKD